MQQNIYDFAYEGTVEFLKKFRSGDYFLHAIDKIQELLQKKQYIKLTMSAGKGFSHSNYFALRYGVHKKYEGIDPVSAPFKKDQKMEVKKQNLEQMKVVVRKKARTLSDFKKETETYLKQVEHDASKLEITEIAIQSYKKNIKELQDLETIIQKQIDFLQRYSKSVFSVSSYLQEKEGQYVLTVAKHFLKLMNQAVKEMFPNKKVYVKFHTQELLKKFKERKEAYQKKQWNPTWSDFEYDVISFLPEIHKAAHIVFIEDGYDIVLNLYTNLQVKITHLPKLDEKGIEKNSQEINELFERSAFFAQSRKLVSGLFENGFEDSYHPLLKKVSQNTIELTNWLTLNTVLPEEIQHFNELISERAKLMKNKNDGYRANWIPLSNDEIIFYLDQQNIQVDEGKVHDFMSYILEKTNIDKIIIERFFNDKWVFERNTYE